MPTLPEIVASSIQRGLPTLAESVKANNALVAHLIKNMPKPRKLTKLERKLRQIEEMTRRIEDSIAVLRGEAFITRYDEDDC